MGDSVRLAILGAGNFGRLHALVAAAHHGVTSCGVVDPDPGARRATARVVGDDVPVVPTLGELGTVDAVVVATPDDAHLEPVRDALAAGRHVLLEKPLATTRRDAAEICALAESASANGLLCRVGHLLRFEPRTIWLRNLVASGAVGEPIHIAMHRDGLRELSEVYPTVSPMAQGGVHDLDLCTWITGRPILSVVGRSCGTGTAPTSTTALVQLDGGTIATVRASRTLPAGTQPAPRTWLEIATTTALITMVDDDRPRCSVDGLEPPRASTVPEMLADQLSAFLAEIAGEGPTNLATPDEALRAVDAALAIDESAAHAGATADQTSRTQPTET